MKNSQKADTQSLEVRKLNPEEQVAQINRSGIVDARKKRLKSFGATFFLRPKAVPATEKEAWIYLEQKLRKRIKD